MFRNNTARIAYKHTQITKIPLLILLGYRMIIYAKYRVVCVCVDLRLDFVLDLRSLSDLKYLYFFYFFQDTMRMLKQDVKCFESVQTLNYLAKVH